MVTVAQAFEQFIQGLKLKERERDEADRLKSQVFEDMKQHLRPTEAVLSGSYGRRTCVRPLHDVDLFLVFQVDRDATTPASLLKQVANAVRDVYEVEPKYQRRSINLVFKSGIGFDIVPALEDGDIPGYWIPDRDIEDWIPTNPRAHKDRCNDVNERAGKKLKPLIKAIKRWDREQGRHIPSFLLEAISYRAPIDPATSYAEGLAALFEFCQEAIQLACPDPAGVGPDIDEGWHPDRRAQAAERLSGAARKALRALEAEAEGDLATAHELWGKLLGEAYLGT